MGGKGRVAHLTLSLALSHVCLHTSSSITLGEVNAGPPLPISLQHDCHAPPHLNTMKPQLHLIIDMVR